MAHMCYSSFFADKMSKVSLNERNGHLAKKKIERSGINNPHSRMDGLNTKGPR